METQLVQEVAGGKTSYELSWCIKSDERVAPVAYQVILEPGMGQFREFESPRAHTRTNSWGLFLCTN